MDNISTSSKSNYCRVCKKPNGKSIFSAIIFDKEVKYYECKNCSYVQTEFPYWIDRAYKDSLTNSDTGILQRNLMNAKYVLASLILLKNRNLKVLDYAGGIGILTRLLRDYGINAFWYDKFCANILARNFEYNKNLKIDLITAFEVFEHLVDPEKEVENLIKKSRNILISTDLIPSPTPAITDWWYYGTEHGQHIGFFRIKTLEYIASKHNLCFKSNGYSMHFFSDKPISSLRWFFLRLIVRLPIRFLTLGLTSRTWPDHIESSNFPRDK